MTNNLIKPSMLKQLLNLTESRRYEFKCFISKNHMDRYLLFNDNSSLMEVIAKLVNEPGKGELEHWPNLHQENLNPLLEMITIDEKLCIFISPFVGKPLKEFVISNSFTQHPKCYDRKKKYAKDILLGLDYLHDNSLCLLNLSAENVQICCKTDKAIITNFTFTSSFGEINGLKMKMEGLSKIAESLDSVEVQGYMLDMWDFGIICLQMFTRFYLPLSNNKNKLLNGLTAEVVKISNCGSYLTKENAMQLKGFLENFLKMEASFRLSAKDALKLDFLLPSTKRLDESAREYWTEQDYAGHIIEWDMVRSLSSKLPQKFNQTNMCRRKPIKLNKLQRKSIKNIQPLAENTIGSHTANCKKSYSFKSLKNFRNCSVRCSEKIAHSCPTSRRRSVTKLIRNSKCQFLRNINENEKLAREENKTNNLSANEYFSINKMPAYCHSHENSRSHIDPIKKIHSTQTINKNELKTIEKKDIFFNPCEIDNSGFENKSYSDYLHHLDTSPDKSEENHKQTVIKLKNESINTLQFCVHQDGSYIHNICCPESKVDPTKIPKFLKIEKFIDSDEDVQSKSSNKELHKFCCSQNSNSRDNEATKPSKIERPFDALRNVPSENFDKDLHDVCCSQNSGPYSNNTLATDIDHKVKKNKNSNIKIKNHKELDITIGGEKALHTEIGKNKRFDHIIRTNNQSDIKIKLYEELLSKMAEIKKIDYAKEQDEKLNVKIPNKKSPSHKKSKNKKIHNRTHNHKRLENQLMDGNKFHNKSILPNQVRRGDEFRAIDSDLRLDSIHTDRHYFSVKEKTTEPMFPRTKPHKSRVDKIEVSKKMSKSKPIVSPIDDMPETEISKLENTDYSLQTPLLTHKEKSVWTRLFCPGIKKKKQDKFPLITCD